MAGGPGPGPPIDSTVTTTRESICDGQFVMVKRIVEDPSGSAANESSVGSRTVQLSGTGVHKLLESANIKVGIVATDILGASDQAMLGTVMAGEADGTF